MRQRLLPFTLVHAFLSPHPFLPFISHLSGSSGPTPCILFDFYSHVVYHFLNTIFYSFGRDCSMLRVDVALFFPRCLPVHVSYFAYAQCGGPHAIRSSNPPRFQRKFSVLSIPLHCGLSILQTHGGNGPHAFTPLQFTNLAQSQQSCVVRLL